MPTDEDDDLYDEEFDFVDDEDEETEEDSELVQQERLEDREFDQAEDEEALDEYGRPKPVENYVVHIYEHRRFKRTIERPFTPEDAEAFATEYNRTGKSYGRVALAGKNEAKPKKSLD